MEYVQTSEAVLAEHAAMHLRRIWLAWEKLRILYNYLLLSEGLTGLVILRLLGTATGHTGLLHGPALWFLIVLVGFFANLFYFLGPVAEMFACAVVGRRAERLRPYLFMCGLFFSMYVIFCMGARMWSHLVGWLH